MMSKKLSHTLLNLTGQKPKKGVDSKGMLDFVADWILYDVLREKLVFQHAYVPQPKDPTFSSS